MTAALRAIIGFEKSTKFFWFFECLVAVLRMFIERVIMLVVFLSAVRDFIANQSASSSERLGFYEAFWGIGSAILLAILALGAVGLVNVLVMSRKEKFFAQPGTWVKPPQFFQDGKDYKNFSKLWISSIIAALIMLWFEAAFAIPFFFLALLASFPIKKLLRWRGGFRLWLDVFGENILDLAILSTYFLALCCYFFINGAPELGLGGLFVLVLVPRVPFGFLANLLARQERTKND